VSATEVRLPNDGKTDRKVKFTLLGSGLGTSVAVLADLPEMAQKAAVALVDLHPDVEAFVGQLAKLGVVGLALLPGWLSGYRARKGLRDG